LDEELHRPSGPIGVLPPQSASPTSLLCSASAEPNGGDAHEKKPALRWPAVVPAHPARPTLRARNVSHGAALLRLAFALTWLRLCGSLFRAACFSSVKQNVPSRINRPKSHESTTFYQYQCALMARLAGADRLTSGQWDCPFSEGHHRHAGRKGPRAASLIVWTLGNMNRIRTSRFQGRRGSREFQRHAKHKAARRYYIGARCSARLGSGGSRRWPSVRRCCDATSAAGGGVCASWPAWQPSERTLPTA